MGWILATTTLSQLIEWVMEMLVNTHAELTTVKGKVNQLFILQSQVNVDLTFFPSVALLIFWRFFFFFFILSPFLNCTFEFYAQVLLKLILSSRISRLPITRRLSSFALWAVSLHLRYSGLRMGWIAVTTTLSRFAKRDLKTLVSTSAAPKTAKEAKTQLSGSKWREVRFLFTYRKNLSR